MKSIRIKTKNGVKSVLAKDTWDTLENDGTIKSYALYRNKIYCVVQRDFDGAIFEPQKRASK